jgi:hypothetical protein
VRSAITPENFLGAFKDFLRTEQGKHPKYPQILIAGSSLSGMGLHVGELERRMGMPTAQLSVCGGTASDVLGILECYLDEYRFAHTVFLELAPGRLTYEHPHRRKQFFDDVRGIESNGTLLGFLQRCSMPYFVQLYREHKKSRRSQDNSDNLSTPFFEKYWDDPKFKADIEKDKPPLRQRAEQSRENRKNSIPEDQPLMLWTKGTGNDTYRANHIEALDRLMDLCRSRNIFVVVCITPEWYGQLNFTQNDIEKPTDDPYLSLLREINARPDCTVIVCRDFEEITDEGTDDDYLFDYGHMTREGATVYTNWLVDRLQETPKTAEMIRIHHEQKQATVPSPTLIR